MATRTIANGGGNWNTAATWSEGVVPRSIDGVVATATSGNLTIDGIDCVCSTANFTNYVNTLTFSAGQQLRVLNAVTFVAGMTIVGTGTLRLDNSSSISSGGVTFPGSIVFDGGTWTLMDNWSVTGNVTFQSGANVLNGNFNNETMTIYGSLSVAGGNLSGSAGIVLAGTGTLSTEPSRTIANNLTINTNGTITLGTDFYFTNKTLTYVAGTVDSTTNSSTVSFGLNSTINMSGVTFYNVALAGSLTLSSKLTCSGYLKPTSSLTINVLGADIECADLTMPVRLSSGSGNGIKMSAGRTLSVTNSITIAEQNSLASYADSTPIYLNYSGAMNNCKISVAILTDVDATGSDFVLPAYLSAVTRCTNILSATPADIAINGFPDASKVYAGTDIGNGTPGTLRASNIAAAAGSGSNLSAGILKSGEVVDDITGTYALPSDEEIAEAVWEYADRTLT